MGVSEIILERHGIAANPGKKLECPFCGHQTFSIKGDDSIGKCFHPSCGKFIAGWQRDNAGRGAVFKTFQKLYEDFHEYLLSLKNRGGSNAYSYLVEDRKIHPQVVADSMLGATPPEYDIEKAFDLCGEKAGRTGVRENVEENLSGIIEKLRICLSGREGWLCFFYTDQFHRIVSIKLRQAYSKNFAYFKPFRQSGLFGHSLFSRDRDEKSLIDSTKLIICEGEFNQLQLQSLSLRYSEATSRPANYLYAGAVGGVNNADFDTISELSRNPVICYDNDSSKAGYELVTSARSFLSLEAFTTAEPDTDIDEFILSLGDDHVGAWEATKELVKKRRFYGRDFEPIEKRVFHIRQHQGTGDRRRQFEIESEVSKTIKVDLHERGEFYSDGQSGYFFDKSERSLIEFSLDCQPFISLIAKYGIIRSESIFKYVTESLKVEAVEKGIFSRIHRLAYYDLGYKTVYLYDFRGGIYKITTEEIALVDNGTDGVLFIYDDKAEPFKLVTPSEGSSPFHDFIISKIGFAKDGLSIDDRRIAFLLWFCSIFFLEIMPTRPILALIGEKGSGKSMTARKVGRLIYGKHFEVTPVSKDPKDFDAAVSHSALVALDNADTKSDWLNDRLAALATGSSIKKRELYTTNRMVEIPTNCFLIITSRTPSFRRDDVADRLLIMRVNRFTDFKSEKSLLNEVTENRNLIMSEVIYFLQEILKALEAGKGIDDAGSFRMADFADFAIKIGRYSGIESEVRDILEKLSHEQSEFTLEGDPIFELLGIWVTDSRNQGREVTNSELCQELKELSEKEKIFFPYKDNPRGFAQKMKNIRPNLVQFFEIGHRERGGRKVVFSFRLKEAK